MITPPACRLVAMIDAHGDPERVLRIAEQTLAAPSSQQVVLRMRRAPINPADINVMEGSYGRLPPLPAVVGNEGVGEIIACGKEVKGLQAGDWVRPGETGTWCSWMVTEASACLRLPPLPHIDQAAMLTVNPATAWRVLEDFARLEAGDWVVQNAATSAVGRCLIALCRERGLRCACLVRRPEALAELSALGADAVVMDDRAAAATLIALTADRPPRLAINAVGGDSAATLAKVLAPGGTLVTIGAMARRPLQISNGALIFKELRLVGFWISAWYRRAAPDQRDHMLAELAARLADGRLQLPVERVYPLGEVAAAVAHARQGGRRGKILLACDANG